MKLLMTVMGLLTITSTAMADLRLSEACTFSVKSVGTGSLIGAPVVLQTETENQITESIGAASADDKAYARVRTLKETSKAVMTIYIGEAKVRSAVMAIPSQAEVKFASSTAEYLLSCEVKDQSLNL